MKIFFICCEEPENPASFPLGVGLLSAMLKEQGHRVKGLHVHEALNSNVLDGVVEKVKQFDPDLIAYSCTSPAFQYIKIIADRVSREINIPSICGGSHPTLYPLETLAENGFDYVGVGEGEKSLIEFAASLEKGEDCSKIPGILNKNNHKGNSKCNLYPLVKDLDSLPWTDYDVLGDDFVKRLTSGGWLRYISARGCPYNCDYCHIPMFKKIYSEGINTSVGKLGYIRLRSVDSMIAEISSMVSKYDLKVINFMDDLFCLKKSRTLEFCDKFKNQLPESTGYSIQTHLQHMDEEVLDALYDSRCLRVVVGIESGTQRILNLLNRKTTPDMITEKLSIMVKRQFPLGTWSLVILGNPTETYEEMVETLKLNAEVLVERVKFNIMAPYPNSKLYDFCIENNLLWEDSETQEFKFRNISCLKFPEKEKAFLEKLLDISHWYMNLSAPLELEQYYQPMIEEVEQIGPGEWNKVREKYLKKDAQLLNSLENKKIPHYRFVLKGKVYSNVIGLLDGRVSF